MNQKTVVISQPMFFPWIGLFEQIQVSDIFIYYDDVQFSKGSFENRVQIKTANGLKWLTVPVKHDRLSQTILETRIDERRDWRTAHLAFLRQQFFSAPFREDVLEIVRSVYEKPATELASLCMRSMDAICTYFGLADPQRMVRSSQLGIDGNGSQRVLDIVRAHGADRYVTGHGATNYLDHEAFEEAGVRVEYMDYMKNAYKQLFGPFTASVSILDLVANLGREGAHILGPRTIYWRDYISGRG